MSIIKYIISIISAACLCSCAADHTLHYSNVTMGNFVDGTFVSDQGQIYDIVHTTLPVDTDTLKRAIISCDIITRTEDDRYDVRLTDFEPVFTKEPVDSTAVTDNEIFADDALNIDEVWYSAGYLNLHIYIPVKEGSMQAHMINLVRNDENAADGIYEFSFRHNAYGEVITASDKDFTTSSRYVSFPLSQLFKDGEQKLQVIFRWTSYEELNGKLSAKTKKNITTLEIERGGYEHKPLK